MEDQAYQKLIGLGLSYVSIRPRSEKELREYLSKKIRIYSMDQQVQQSVMDRLSELGYIDDVVFAVAYIQSQNRFRPKGKMLVTMGLKRKGVSDQAITQAFQQVQDENGEEEGSGGTKEKDLALQAGTKRLRSLIRYDSLERKNKLYSFLIRRGFDHDTIAVVVDELVSKGLQ